MDTATQGFLIMAAFALAHERFLEFIRWFMEKLPKAAALGTVRTLIDALTAGPWAIIPGIALAVGTNANMLDAFRMNADRNPLFFDDYLNGTPSTLRAVVGCVMMGLSVTLGSSFWHDLAKGLIDARTRLRAVDSPSMFDHMALLSPPKNSAKNVVVAP